MVTVISLYICISYIYTYSYNFYYLSSLQIACQSFLLHVLCLWHISYLYFYYIYVSILCIFHIHSITYCSMSLAYLLSILLLYSCFYTLHIPYSFYNLLLYVHVLLSFTVHVLYSCTNFIYYIHVMFMYYFHILFSFYTFHIAFSFMYCTCSYTFRVLSYTFLYNRVSSYFVLYYSCASLYFHLVIFIDYTFL